MSIRILLFATALTLGQMTTSAGQTPPDMSEPVVSFGLFRVQADGPPRGWASQSAGAGRPQASGWVTISPCPDLGAARSGQPLSDAATDVWRLSTHVTSISSDTATAQLTWERVRRNGREESGTPQSTTVTLERNERVRLEDIHVPANGQCEARTLALEAVFAAPADVMESIAAAGEARANAADSRAPGAPASAQERPRIFRMPPNASGISRTAIARAGEPAPTTLMADLWLVRSVPGQPDETLHVTAPVIQIPVRFAFTPLVMQADGGEATVQVEGTVELGMSPGGEPRFFFSAGRRVGFIATNRPARDGASTNESSTKTSVRVPGPDEVISFELPPVQVPGGGEVPERLSIRVRLTPQPMVELTR